jgi:T-complex protein 1 subunit beta
MFHLLQISSTTLIVDMELGQVASMRDLGITESYKLKKQVVVSASEAAEMILRVDNILRATPRRREGM